MYKVSDSDLSSNTNSDLSGYKTDPQLYFFLLSSRHFREPKSLRASASDSLYQRRNKSPKLTPSNNALKWCLLLKVYI